MRHADADPSTPPLALPVRLARAVSLDPLPARQGPLRRMWSTPWAHGAAPRATGGGGTRRLGRWRDGAGKWVRLPKTASQRHPADAHDPRGPGEHATATMIRRITTRSNLAALCQTVPHPPRQAGAPAAPATDLSRASRARRPVHGAIPAVSSAPAQASSIRAADGEPRRAGRAGDVPQRGERLLRAAAQGTRAA